jgi:RND superfamily putative drug exporter
LLLVTFRSLVVPIKAIVLNLLSVGAAYGVLVLVFQDRWGEGLLGFHSNGGVSSWVPMFLFVILFGLSMDYHVLILSRVREGIDRGMSSDDAVREGISSTAGTVTSAARGDCCGLLDWCLPSSLQWLPRFGGNEPEVDPRGRRHTRRARLLT